MSGEECLWKFDPQADSKLDSLQGILRCASLQGCDQCVPCSERALDLFLRQARIRAGHA
ncbi:MAG TPA: hypothetical protein VK196_10710 [Magnetospirillum sp.]|nr:hypothetical protein [Magnetospirillum sp.]